MKTAGLLVGVVAVVALGSAGVRTSSDECAPERLRDTQLETLGRPFAPQYSLWSDGATKRRWVYLPPGSTIDARNDDNWEFPVGTRFWKEFAFNGRKVETRMLWKASASRWIAASYIWNEEGTDAVLAPRDGAPGVYDIAAGKRHSIPSSDECLMCHGTKKTGPLGFNALQLSTDRDPNAIHGEPLAPGMVTLETLIAEGVLTPTRSDLIANPPRIRANDPLTRSVLGYLAANCGHCHNQSGDIATLGPSLKHSDVVRDGQATAARLVDHPTHWQVPGVPDGASTLVSSRAPDASAILVRMRSRRPSSQMPPLGTVIRDEDAVAAVTRWVSDLTKNSRNDMR